MNMNNFCRKPLKHFIPLTAIFLLTSCASKMESTPRGEVNMPTVVSKLTKLENTAFIILFPDNNGGYLKQGEIFPPKEKALDIWVQGNSGNEKIKYEIFAKTNEGYVDLRKEKFELIIDFKDPAQAQTNQDCPNPVEWKDGKKKQVLKVNQRFIKIKKSKHKDNACYNYDISVDTKSGQAPIEIDPWLRIRHR